jgi:predicted amidohydrolase
MIRKIIISIGFILLIISPSRSQNKNFVFIDLSSVANRGFYDEVAGDSTGGWTDFGPTACFTDLTYGITTYQDGIIPFNIIDPEQNKGRSAVVLSGPRREKTFPDQSDKIIMENKVAELYFLHTCTYVDRSGNIKPLIKYRIHYDDNSEHVFTCYRGMEVDDWWDPSSTMPRCFRTYNEGNLWLINTPWINPFPDKTISWIRMESAGNGIPILVALTGSTKNGPYADMMDMINQKIVAEDVGVLKLALVQPYSVKDQQENLDRGIEYCKKAKERGADIVLFPELYNIGYQSIGFSSESAMNEWDEMAVPADGTFVNTFRKLARGLDMAIMITFLEESDGLPKNSAALIDRHGEVIFIYSKVHTCDFTEIEVHTSPGDGFKVGELDTRFGPVNTGAMICYDRESPESARILMLKGAEIILTPNACNLHPMLIDQFKVRAFENALVVAMANYAPDRFSENYNGSSCVFNARGDELLMAGRGEGLYFTDIDLGELRKYRKKTIYGNAFRRPHKYELLDSPEVEQTFKRENILGKPFIRLER